MTGLGTFRVLKMHFESSKDLDDTPRAEDR
jgi:hypothetical protein